VKTLRGRVVHGEGVGKKLGFPTANIKIAATARPPRGVWRVKVSGAGLDERDAVCNVGVRPTLGGTRLVVEAHVPGFKGDLYGKTLTVAFVSPIRAEKKFPSLAALKAQIRKDVASLTRGGVEGTLNA